MTRCTSVVLVCTAQYNEVVARSMSSELVGGSDECLGVLTKGHEQVGHMLTSRGGRRELSRLFNLCNDSALEDEDNRRVFAGDGVVFLPVQSNDPACQEPNCDIRSVCKTLTEARGREPVQALAALSNAQHDGQC